MRNISLIVIGVLLFATGAGLGVVLQRVGFLGNAAARRRTVCGIRPPTAGGRDGASEKPVKAQASGEKDQRASTVCGFYRAKRILTEAPFYLRGEHERLRFRRDDRLHADIRPRHCLEERNGERFLLYSDEGVVLFKYRLEGDRLELEDRPMDRPAGWELDHPRK